MNTLRTLVTLVAVAAVSLTEGNVHAFCGFYVAGADSEIFNNATMVVMMRHGTTTVLSMQNDYQGPAEDFAMVVPVPTVLSEEHVRTLPREVFDRVDTLAAPRLVEYWEQDPCHNGTIGLGNLGTIGHGGGSGSGSGFRGRSGGGLQVRVEAEFAVGEYEIVILSADDSSDLDTWLRQSGYRIPAGAEDALRPYVTQGMKFFVAKVDAAKVAFEDGKALLSPLRIHYQSDAFSLPVRLGMLNSSGTQDLVVHTLGQRQRFEVANYENVTIPTNLDVADATRDRFGEFYAALFDHTLEQNPGAVVTEYSWQATGCDPCPGPVLSVVDLVTLGADVALGRDVAPEAVQVGRPEAGDGVDVNVVRRIFRRHRNRLRSCVQGHGVSDPSITFDFDITSTGGVANLRTTGLDRSPAGAEACFEDAVRDITFPPVEGEPVAVHYPLALTRLAAGGMGPYNSFVLTRLHYRYGQDQLGEDLVFREAEGIIGGRERVGEDGTLESGARPSPTNNFQGRYAIRHPWTGDIECDEPARGVWGSNPEGGAATSQSASRPANVQRGGVTLTTFVTRGLPGANAPVEAPEENDEESEPADEVARALPVETQDAGGCGGCSANAHDDAPMAALLVMCVVLGRRRR